jgi:hypothetical protein
LNETQRHTYATIINIFLAPNPACIEYLQIFMLLTAIVIQ